MIWFNGFPFLDNKEERTFGVPVSHVMNQGLTVIPSTGMTLEDVGEFNSRLSNTVIFFWYLHVWMTSPEYILETTDFQGFPIVQDRNSKLLLGYINRTELKFGIREYPPPF